MYDTGSDWLTVEAYDCENCMGENYKWRDSTQFKYIDKKNFPLTYGSAKLEGKRITDQVCFTNEND